MQIEINGKQCDLSKVHPITIGDFELLEEKGVELLKQTGQETVAITSPKKIRILVQWAIQKCNSDVTEEEIKNLPMTELSGIMSFINDTAGKSTDSDGTPPNPT